MTLHIFSLTLDLVSSQKNSSSTLKIPILVLIPSKSGIVNLPSIHHRFPREKTPWPLQQFYVWRYSTLLQSRWWCRAYWIDLRLLLHSHQHTTSLRFLNGNTAWLHLEILLDSKQSLGVATTYVYDQLDRTLHSGRPCNFHWYSNRYYLQWCDQPPYPPLQSSSGVGLVARTCNSQPSKAMGTST